MRIYKLLRPLIFSLNPETAHNLAIRFLKSNLFFPHIKEYRNLRQKINGVNFKNPVGMAAGFDKNAQVADALSKFGFGFVECGTVTPRRQAGNKKPRIFRLTQDKAIINRLGFNNHGVNDFERNLKKLGGNRPCPIGINIGKNKDSKEAVADYLTLLDKLYLRASYIVINISSPNTKNLRDIQKQEHLNVFLKEIMKKKAELVKKTKKDIAIFLKIAPDLTIEEQQNISASLLKNKIDGVIVSNTTISREYNLQSSNSGQVGGLSGQPLYNKSNEVLKNIYSFTKGKVPIIGVGGVSSAHEVYEKIKCGASLVQIYSAFIYEGFGLVEEIKRDLTTMVKEDGFKNISEAIGIACK